MSTVLLPETDAQIEREEADAAKCDDIFARFDDDDRAKSHAATLPLTREAHPELARILGRTQRGVIPAAQIERED